LDQNRIRTLEKKVEELAWIDNLNRNLVQLAHSVQRFIGTDAKLMVANNLLREVFSSDQDPKLLKIIGCNKKYAADIKEVVDRLNSSLGETMDHLIKYEDRMKAKVDESQRSNPDLRKFAGTSGTGTRSLSGLKLPVTPSGSTSSASTPKTLGDSTLETSKIKPDFLQEELQRAMGEIKEEEVKPAEMEVDVDTLDDVKLDEGAPIITKEVLEDK
jgi:hypothetical protein